MGCQHLHRSVLLRLIRCVARRQSLVARRTTGDFVSLPILFAAGVVAASCGGGSSGRGLAVQATPPLVINLPLDRFFFSEERRFIEVARFTRFNRCAVEAGLPPVYPASSLSLDRPASSRPDERRYGINDPDVVNVYGYHLPPASDAFQAPRLSAAEERVLFDSSNPSSCESRSQAEIFGSREEAQKANDGYMFVQDLASDALNEARASEQAVTAATAWQKCIEERGLEVMSVDELVGGPEVANSARGPVATEGELRAATADYECRKLSKYNATVFALETRFQGQRIDDNEDRLNRLESDIETALTRATGILGRNP